MNDIKSKEIIIEKSRKKFVKHKWLFVYIKKNAYVPYEKSFFHKYIADSKNPKLKHKNYILYIHDDYLSIRGNGFPLERVTVELHDELWIELYCVFNVKKTIDKDDETFSFDRPF